MIGTISVVAFLVCLAGIANETWYVAIPSLIVMFAALGYSEGKW